MPANPDVEAELVARFTALSSPLSCRQCNRQGLLLGGVSVQGYQLVVCPLEDCNHQATLSSMVYTMLEDGAAAADPDVGVTTPLPPPPHLKRTSEDADMSFSLPPS